MKVVLDECLPRKLKRYLPGFDVSTVPNRIGSSGQYNRDPLTSRSTDTSGSTIHPTCRANSCCLNQTWETCLQTGLSTSDKQRFHGRGHRGIQHKQIGRA